MRRRFRIGRWLASAVLAAGTLAGGVSAARAAMERPSAALPRVLLMIDEKNIGSMTASEVESLLSRLLLENRFRVVDPKMVQANIAKDQRLLKMAGDPQAAAVLGSQFGADVIISGEAIARPSPRRIADSNLRTYQAVVTLRAVRADDASTLTMTTKEASVIGIDDAVGGSKALQTAGQDAAAAFVPELMEAWTKTTGVGGGMNHITLTAGGIDQAWKLKALRETLNGMPDRIQNLTQRNYTVGLAVFELDTPAKVEELAEALVLKPPQGLRLQILETASGKIELRATPAPQ